ncbi:Anti-sigma-K factor rskA [Chitinophaga jiangningensis]|uniref:Anti-sigma-K factor rskA n=1 Tax=Chitinophaga jiangningensis TaxID=1419482 RepID=A0A1M7G9C6_9BACT|nr:anti-sigma factor [Chitinophaga jiangningensis]SHM12698.1 Anti-sigma-K factor rskA [Chitinophaga jiangningensis]
MDINHYISSGVLESYVYGLLPEDEVAEVEAIALQYPEVKEIVEDLQFQKEEFVKCYAVTPPPEIKARLMLIIRNESTPEGELILPQELRLNNPVPQSPASTPVVKMTPTAAKKKERRWKFIAAAAIIVFAISVGVNFFFATDTNDYKARYEKLIAAQKQITDDKELESNQTASLQESEEDKKLIKDPNVIWVKASGYNTHPDGAVTIGWNTVSHEVYLINWRLPIPPEGKQYHLRTITGGKPADAGILTITPASNGKIQHLKPSTAPQTLVVTLEPTGSTGAPGQAEIYQVAELNP